MFRLCDELSVLDDFIFNSTQAQLVILCPTISNIFSLSIKLHSCTHILSVLPIQSKSILDHFAGFT